MYHVTEEDEKMIFSFDLGKDLMDLHVMAKSEIRPFHSGAVQEDGDQDFLVIKGKYILEAFHFQTEP